MKSIPYREGSLFAVPLRNNGFAVGVVARMAKKEKLSLLISLVRNLKRFLRLQKFR